MLEFSFRISFAAIDRTFHWSQWRIPVRINAWPNPASLSSQVPMARERLVCTLRSSIDGKNLIITRRNQCLSPAARETGS